MRRVQLGMIVIIFIGSLLSGSCTAAENSNGFIDGKNQKSYVSFEKNESSMIISESGKSATIYYSSKDFPGVIRVVKDLQSDISKVTNAKPEIIQDGMPSKGEVIIAGTLGKNSLIDKLVADKKINVDGVKGKWEAYKICTVDNPFIGVSKALVIVGNDKRGSIYGMYDLSEKIGVSPWYWWADVPVKKHDALYINSSTNIIDAPKVKYRGFFINDEAPALSGWSQEKYGTVQFNHKLYVHVFELLLRLKANFLWPAMWGRSFFDDDKMNPVLADEYGIVISTSHHEPMMRAQAL